MSKRKFNETGALVGTYLGWHIYMGQDGYVAQQSNSNLLGPLYGKTQKEIRANIKKIEDDTNKLYKAIQEYVEDRGGKVVVIGGVEIQQWPDDKEYRFYVAVKVTGRKPKLISED